jgi:signal transduction histidine kinase
MGTPLRVLMVEDSDEDTELVIQELRGGGYDVSFERVDTPQAMSATLENRAWDVVICDFSVPHFGCAGALRLLRGRNLDTPFIYVSGTIGEETAVAALKQGAHDYVMKGSLQRLLPAIQRELQAAEQRRQEAQLERQVRQQERFEAIGRLAGGIAHDFNNIIGAILGWAELGEEEAGSGSRLQDRFSQIRNQAERAAGLTTQLLAFARRQVLLPVKLDVNKSISEMHSFLTSGMEDNIEFKTVLDPHLDIIESDASQIGQVTMNLCINARDAMPRGGRLIVETHNVQIDEEFCRLNSDSHPGRYVMLMISDTGIGMDAATVDRIFEPFFTTKELGTGTGLGLATVYGIVKQHDGFLNVRSEVGKGTTFRVYFPSSTGRVSQRQPDKTPISVTGSETILLAEDHEGIREVTHAILSSYGYTVILAADGREALQLFRQDPTRIDLVILDVAMPGLDGTEVFTQMSAVRPDLPVVFTSGNTSESASLTATIAAGAVFLQKPYSPRALGQIVRSTLDRQPPSKSEASRASQPQGVSLPLVQRDRRRGIDQNARQMRSGGGQGSQLWPSGAPFPAGTCSRWLPGAVPPQVGDMLQKQNKPQNQMCFQIHKNGRSGVNPNKYFLRTQSDIRLT